MALSRPISLSFAAISLAQSCGPFLIVQPKPAASSAQPPYSPACTSSFFGTQPTLTQVPPQKRSSATATRAPWPAAMRPQRTPAEPPPITNRSKSMRSILAFALTVSPPGVYSPCSLARSHAIGMDRPPDPLRGHRHLDMRHAELGQRVDHGVHHDAQRRRRAALPSRA